MAKKLTRLSILQQQKELLEKTNPKKEVIAELDEQIKRSKRGRSAKKKGASYELTIAKLFKEHFGINLTRTPQSGGFAKKAEVKEFKGDIVCLDPNVSFQLHVECKNQKTLSMKSWLEQAKSDCPQDRIPVVIFHQNREITGGKVSQTNEDYITLRLSDFFAIAERSAIFKEV